MGSVPGIVLVAHMILISSNNAKACSTSLFTNEHYDRTRKPINPSQNGFVFIDLYEDGAT